MIRIIYIIITSITRFAGSWVFAVAAWIISTGYFIFFPSRVKVSTRFYRALIPGKSSFYYLGCAWKQFHSFNHVFRDQFFLQNNGNISYTSDGWSILENVSKNKTGAIILTSHVGNWDIAAHLLKERGLNLLLYMGSRQKEQLEKMQKENLEEKGLKIIAVDKDTQSPFDIIEGINFLKNGGLVAIAGDLIWGESQRSVPAKFLRHKVLLPEAPHIIALLSGAPLCILFTFRTGKRKYHFSITGPSYVKSKSRSDRKKAISESVQYYADLLEQRVQENPYQWFHFSNFLEEKID